MSSVPSTPFRLDQFELQVREWLARPPPGMRNDPHARVLVMAHP